MSRQQNPQPDPEEELPDWIEPYESGSQAGADAPIVDRLLAKLKADAIGAEAALRRARHLSSSEISSRYQGAAKHVFLLQYEQWLSDQLVGSGLAQLIPGGIDSLPGIYRRMPWFVRSLELAQKPDSPEELLNHLYGYLDCYVDSSRKPMMPTALVVGIAFAIICAMIVPLTVMYLEESTLWILVLIAALLTFRVWQVVDVTGHRTEKRIANIVCLEWYLRNTYGDVDPELEGQAVNVDWS